jgi:predicted MFS family arabinose efflux permease
LLRVPGARGPVVASALGSLPIGMYILAILLLAREATGSFAEAGRVSGAFGLANALGAVAQGRLMDRLGQPPVLRVAAAGHALAVAALVVAAERRAPTVALLLCAVAGGACLPQVPAAMRSLWSVLVEDEERRQAAYAMVAIVFEVSVVAAPALVAAIITVASPAAATAAAAVLASGAALAFAATGASRRWRGEAHAVGWLGPLSAPGVRTVFAALAALGGAIGIVQVAVPAFTAEGGSAETGGLLLAALSAGSLAGGVVYGARSWPGRPATRLALMLTALAGACALLATAGSNLGLGAMLLAVGVLLAPTTIVGSALLDVVAPAGTVTEAFTVMIMGIVAGNAAGNALGGAIVDGPGYETAALASAAIAAAGAATTYARRSSLGTRKASTARSS